MYNTEDYLIEGMLDKMEDMDMVHDILGRDMILVSDIKSELYNIMQDYKVELLVKYSEKLVVED